MEICSFGAVGEVPTVGLGRCVRGIAMGLALGCPLELAGVCETRVWAGLSVERLRCSSRFQFDAEVSGFGCPPT